MFVSGLFTILKLADLLLLLLILSDGLSHTLLLTVVAFFIFAYLFGCHIPLPIDFFNL